MDIGVWSEPEPKAPVSEGTPETNVEGVALNTIEVTGEILEPAPPLHNFLLSTMMGAPDINFSTTIGSNPAGAGRPLTVDGSRMSVLTGIIHLRYGVQSVVRLLFGPIFYVDEHLHKIRLIP